VGKEWFFREEVPVIARLVKDFGCRFVMEPMEAYDWEVPDVHTGSLTGEVVHYTRLLLTVEFPAERVLDSECAKVGHMANVEGPRDLRVPMEDGTVKVIPTCGDDDDLFDNRIAIGLRNLRQTICWAVVNGKLDVPESALRMTEDERRRYCGVGLSETEPAAKTGAEGVVCA